MSTDEKKGTNVDMTYRAITDLWRVAYAARDLINRIDDITTEDFSRGGERDEREALRKALLTVNAAIFDLYGTCRECGRPVEEDPDAHPWQHRSHRIDLAAS